MDNEKSLLKIRQDRSLLELLKVASNDELVEIANIITDNGKGRISLATERLQEIETALEQGKLHEHVDILAYEIRAFGSNSVASRARRGEPVSYKEVLCDVAKKLGVKKPNKDALEIELEEQILMSLLTKVHKDKSVEEIRELIQNSNYDLTENISESMSEATDKATLYKAMTSSVGFYPIAKLLAGAFTRHAVVSSGKIASTSALVVRGATMLNPLGIAISAIWTTYELSGPAFRVTIPLVLHIALIRQTQIKFEIERAKMELIQCL
ncbi:hypothetical protein EXT46_11000 [Pseudoalteromonas sp. CO325X]|uniref:hypothetical protein n=1 Tax=Pseudoalteromonas sp. CO325X TaxID=1777262 RepID=UPI0010236C8F|nr:hypothetical protein [Pseudoalteromonas sp. CO325X]RZF80541.1 hypothetical protein EXT46_11000 [Pseudoalteromonas sp. CO325X]